MRIRRMGLRPAALLRSVGSMRDKMGRNISHSMTALTLQRVAYLRETGIAVLKVKQAVLHGVISSECLLPSLGVMTPCA